MKNVNAKRVKRSKFLRIISETTGVSTSVTWREAIDAVLLAGVSKFKRLSELGVKTYSVPDSKSILVDSEGNVVCGVVGFVHYDNSLPRFEVFYIDEDDKLQLWDTYEDEEISKETVSLDVIRSHFGNLGTEQSLTAGVDDVVSCVATAVFQRFLSVTMFTDDEEVAKDRAEAEVSEPKTTSETVNEDELKQFFTPGGVDESKFTNIVCTGTRVASGDVPALMDKIRRAGQSIDDAANNLLRGDTPLFKELVAQVQFDNENVEIVEIVHFNETGELGFKLVNGLPFIIGYAGGDWENPVGFVIYLGVDGELHGYVPADGNVYEPLTRTAYGSVDQSKIPEWSKLSDDEFERRFNIFEDGDAEREFDFDKMIADVVKTIRVA